MFNEPQKILSQCPVRTPGMSRRLMTFSEFQDTLSASTLGKNLISLYPKTLRMQQDDSGCSWLGLESCLVTLVALLRMAWWPWWFLFRKKNLPQSSGAGWIKWTTHRPKNSQAKRVPSCWIVFSIYHCFHPQMLLWHSCPRKMISLRSCCWTLYCCWKKSNPPPRSVA